MVLAIERWPKAKNRREIRKCRCLAKGIGKGKALKVKKPRRVEASDLI